jgi:hypothetical protein
VDEELADGDGPTLLRVVGDVRLNLGVEVELAALGELHDGRPRHGLGDGGEAVGALGGRGRLVFEVGVAEALDPREVALREADGHPRNPVALLVGAHELLELPNLRRVPFGDLRRGRLRESVRRRKESPATEHDCEEDGECFSQVADLLFEGGSPTVREGVLKSEQKAVSGKQSGRITGPVCLLLTAFCLLSSALPHGRASARDGADDSRSYFRRYSRRNMTVA